MKGLKRVVPLILCLLLCGSSATTATVGEGLWRRVEGDGSYVTVRVPAEKGLSILNALYLAVRYADTGEPVPLSSEYLDGYIFATVPAQDADRPLAVFQGDETTWTDLRASTTPSGTEFLHIRGILQGDEAGQLNQDASLTRAEAAALIARLLCLEPAEDPGYSDVSPEDWYYGAVSAVRSAGIAPTGDQFAPQRPVVRWEFMLLLARAMETVGWLEIPEDAASTDLDLVDASAVPDCAVGAYLALMDCGRGLFTEQFTDEILEGFPVTEELAEPELPVCRGEAITLVSQTIRWLPWYPTEAAIQLGFDLEMPVIDGSTSTYPCTSSLYRALFSNYSCHPPVPGEPRQEFRVL